MPVTIIIPAFNNFNELPECLHAIKTAATPDTETLVIDDASTDGTARLTSLMDVKGRRLCSNSGPAAARNCGASLARNEILFFVDADVAIAPDAIRRVEQVFDERPDIAAVFGSYDASPKASGLISQYRNLLHHFIHQNSHEDAVTFWAGCGAIRRAIFEQVGGFDAKRFRHPSIEDVELGYRLRAAGYRILLDKDLQGKHLKRWNLYSLIQTDVTRRAIPWSRLILETRTMPNDLNLTWDQRVSFVLTVLTCVSLAMSTISVQVAPISAVLLIALAVLNRRIFLFFFRQRGLAFALGCMPLHALYYLYSGFTYLGVRSLSVVERLAIALSRWFAGRPPDLSKPPRPRPRTTAP